MFRLMCKGKIHRARVTEANLGYVGSVTIDADLMEEARILPFEVVQITSLENGTRWKTYALPAPRGSGVLCLNGPPARHFQPGDTVIILSEGFYHESELDALVPRVVFVDEKNHITSVAVHDEGLDLPK